MITQHFTPEQLNALFWGKRVDFTRPLPHAYQARARRIEYLLSRGITDHNIILRTLSQKKPYQRPKPRRLRVFKKAHPLVKTLVKRINQRHLYAKDVAARAGVNAMTFNSWRTGHHHPSIYHFSWLAEAVGLELALIDKQTGEKIS